MQNKSKADHIGRGQVVAPSGEGELSSKMVEDTSGRILLNLHQSGRGLSFIWPQQADMTALFIILRMQPRMIPRWLKIVVVFPPQSTLKVRTKSVSNLYP